MYELDNVEKIKYRLINAIQCDFTVDATFERYSLWIISNLAERFQDQENITK